VHLSFKKPNVITENQEQAYLSLCAVFLSAICVYAIKKWPFSEVPSLAYNEVHPYLNVLNKHLQEEPEEHFEEPGTSVL